MLSKNLTVIKSEIDKLNRKERQAVFEIGKRFKHVKENILKRGQYTKWIREIGYNPDTAQRYVRVYERFGNIEEASNIRVSTLFEMLSLPKTVDIKEFLSREHIVDGQTKKADQLTKTEMRKLVHELKRSSVKPTPATDTKQGSFSFVEELLNRLNLLQPTDEELMKMVFYYFDVRMQRILDLTSEQRNELLYCCQDENYERELNEILDCIEAGMTHLQIRNYFLSKTLSNVD